MVRILSFSEGGSNVSEEAMESSEMRRYLLKQSLIYTFEHPIFGVGLAQFSDYEGGHGTAFAGHGSWHATHNSFTQVSSECGLPALALYLAAIVSTFLMANRVYRQACQRKNCEDIRIASFCITLSMVVYCTGILFVNFAYFIYLPLLTSLVIAVHRAAEVEFANRPIDPVAPQYGLTFQPRRAAPRKALTPSPRA